MKKESDRIWRVVSDAGWIFGFLISYGIFSAVFHFIFLRESSYVLAMLLTGGVLLAGDIIKRWSRE